MSRSALLDSRRPTGVDGPVLTITVADRLASERAERHLALARRIRGSAIGTGRGALGLSEVLAALNDARVEHLIYDPDVRCIGALGEEDVLLASPQAVGVVVQDSRLTEGIVERCQLTAARITPLDRPPRARWPTSAASRHSCAGDSGWIGGDPEMSTRPDCRRAVRRAA